jgi:sensor histidine kinase YesM
MMTVLIHTECSLKEELEALKIRLERAVEEYRGKLSWTLSVGAEVDMGLIIPKKLILLFVENAISGGLIQNGNGGSLEVSAHVTSLGMLIMINDHGISFRDIPLIRQQREHRLRGLDTCLEQFNEKHPYRIHYNMLDRSIHDSEKSGSRILITIQNQ